MNQGRESKLSSIHCYNLWPSEVFITHKRAYFYMGKFTKFCPEIFSKKLRVIEKFLHFSNLTDDDWSAGMPSCSPLVTQRRRYLAEYFCIES